MQQDMNIIRFQVLHHILRPNPLAPISTRTTAHALSQPQTLVIVRGLAALAAAVIAVLVEEAAARLGALRDAVGVDVRVHTVGALDQRYVGRGPPDHADADVGPGEVVEAVELLEPLLVLGREGGGDLVLLRGGDALAGVPADAVVDFAGAWVSKAVG